MNQGNRTRSILPSAEGIQERVGGRSDVESNVDNLRTTTRPRAGMWPTS
jgi:hypothetical protein